MKLILSILISISFVLAGEKKPFIHVSVDQKDYIQYFPVIIDLELKGDSIPPGFLLHPPESRDASYRIEIIRPDDSKVIYKPYVNYDLIDVGSSDVMFTALMGIGNEWLFKDIGLYSIRVLDLRGKLISNTVNFQVYQTESPFDRNAREDIEKNLADYTKYFQLKGGEHLTDAHKLIVNLSKSKSVYRDLAHAILACNYAQKYYDYKHHANSRDVKVGNVLRYMQTIKASPLISDYYILWAGHILRMQTSPRNISEGVRKLYNGTLEKHLQSKWGKSYTLSYFEKMKDPKNSKKDSVSVKKQK